MRFEIVQELKYPQGATEFFELLREVNVDNESSLCTNLSRRRETILKQTKKDFQNPHAVFFLHSDRIFMTSIIFVFVITINC